MRERPREGEKIAVVVSLACLPVPLRAQGEVNAVTNSRVGKVYNQDRDISLVSE